MSVEPWMKWYPSDWRSETRLRMVSRSARSLWIDMLGLMHESPRYGYLLIAGVVPTMAQLASVLGDKPKDIERWLDELEEMDVFSVDDGVIFSRRMVRDKAKRELDRLNGKAGGNPKITPDVNQGVNPPDKAQILEARDQRLEKEKSISAVPALKRISKNLLNGHQKEFDEFWATYPKRVDKRDAMKAYVQALGRADAAVILEGAKGYARSRKDEEPQFTKGPAHWLRADCWLDEAPIAEGNAPDPDFAAALAAEAEHRKKHGEIE